MTDSTEPSLSPRGRQQVRDLAEAFRIGVDEIDTHPAARRLRGLIAHRDRTDFQRDDPVREIVARLGDRWSTLLMFALEAGTMGHATLRRVICAISAEGNISQRMLTLRLRALERDGLVERRVTPTVPPRVDYTLTPMGRDLLTLVFGLVRWIETHNDRILAARAAFEEAQKSDLPGRW